MFLARPRGKPLWRAFLLSMENLMEIRKAFSSPEFSRAQWDQAVDRFERSPAQAKVVPAGQLSGAGDSNNRWTTTVVSEWHGANEEARRDGKFP